MYVPFPYWAVFPVCKMKARGQIILEVPSHSEMCDLMFSNASFITIKMSKPIVPDGEGRPSGQLTKKLTLTKLAHKTHPTHISII